MKTTAKFLSLFLCLAMIFSVGLALVINAAAVEAPSFSMKVIKTERVIGDPVHPWHNKVTVTVNLESGSFNTLEFKFVMSSGVDCAEIVAANGSFICNPSSNKSHVAFADTNAYSQKGTIITAKFFVPRNRESTIGMNFEVCEVTDSNFDNIPVTPKIISTVKITTTTTTTTKRTTTTKKSTTTTTKKPTPVNPTPPNSSSGSGGSGSGGSGNQGGNSIPVYTGSIPGGAVTPGGVTLPDGSTTDLSETVSEDTSLDYDVYASEYFDSTQESETQQASASLDDVMEDSHSNKKVIIIVAIIAALIIAGAVTAVLLIKKRNKGAANEL